ncbi:aldo/keto reductase [Zoogloea sp.]|uniref:aldo/keto reductase n=1 Tax=Zoogloea sp. TaxID=49181 RepID=UPI00263A1C64|nr:aldo/keto reductase [Zoogloea sp.]MDD3354951.1 aldo/keto reductase [Zoogloea sp.]
MDYRLLGASDLRVSAVCLGTMTFGQQNSEAEAHAQLDLALDSGVNFIDAAEMYPVPARRETSGRTESIVGSWLKSRPRDQVVVATKVAGPGRSMEWIRGGPLALDRDNIRAAVEGSLARLQTDYIDLYQIHWPARNQPMFGQWRFDPAAERDATPIYEQLVALAELVAEGKIRYIGLSNEHPWGLMRFQQVADELGLPRVVSVQNAYNLLNRVFEQSLAEVCFREQVSLLPYSVLAFGHLTGKYLEGRSGSGRITLFPAFAQRYDKPGVEPAVQAYAELAADLGMSPAALAIAFVARRPLVGSTILGATSVAQLTENLAAARWVLDDETLARIDAIHLRHTNPAP